MILNFLSIAKTESCVSKSFFSRAYRGVDIRIVSIV